MSSTDCSSVASLGDSASYRVIELYEGYDWRHDLVLRSGVWPDGTAATVKWDNGIRWDAVHEGNRMMFRVDKVDTTVEIVPAGTYFELSVSVPTGSSGDADDVLLHYGSAYRPSRLI